MTEEHPYATAAYRIVTLAEGEVGVEVTVEGSDPTTVRGLKGEAAAEAWIAGHKERVARAAGRARPRMRFKDRPRVQS